ncbi:globin-coupled sensor protein [Haloarcula amylolytica]|uniref:globin-coupled sensor protein n=1 Tax=Haloarcula amylolytica TaxID=396317 RepID=UPI003C75E5EF
MRSSGTAIFRYDTQPVGEYFDESIEYCTFVYQSNNNQITSTDRQQVDGTQLVDKIGIDRQEIKWRKEFTNFDEADKQRLTTLESVVDPVIDEAVEEFYDHLQSYDETIEIFGRSSKGIEALKKNQRQYLHALFDGQYGRQHFQSRARIGKIHDMLDLGPKIYLGAYSVFYEHLIDAVVEDLKSDLAQTDGGVATQHSDALTPDEALDTLADRTRSMLKIMNLDQQVAMDTYIHSYSQQLETKLEQQRQVIADVDKETAEATQAADDIAISTDMISEKARDQADSMGEVSGEVADMSATVEEIASTAEEVATTSENAETLAEEGRTAATKAIDMMERVDDSAKTAAADVGRLQERIDEIDEIVEVINDIADQTNMLALNASIEAARAGDAGDGFAVVANEVKSLAEESQEHAGEIETMVSDIKEDTAETVSSLEQTTEEVDQGIEQVTEAMDTLQDIAQSVQEASQGIREVSDATDDQAASTEEVASMVDELVEQADTVADEIEDVASANDEQAENVKRINNTVQRLTN